MKVVAALLMALVCGQAVQAGPIGAVVGKAIVGHAIKGGVVLGAGAGLAGAGLAAKGAGLAGAGLAGAALAPTGDAAARLGADMAGAIVKAGANAVQDAVETGTKLVSAVDNAVQGVVNQGAAVAGTGAGLAAAALSGLPVTVMDRMTVPANFTIGNGFCFPKFVAAQVSRATLACGEGAMLSLSAMGQTACVKQVYTTTQSCFRTTATCPADNVVDAEQLCLPKEVRSAIVGMLVVFKIEATLPFTILPGLVTSLQKAAAFNLTSAIAQGMQHLQPDNIAKAVATMSAAGQDVMRVLTTNGDPIDLVINAMSNLNMTELLRVLPTINAWISEKLEDLTKVNEVTAAMSALVPTCLNKCCKQDVTVDTRVSVATRSCPEGMRFNALLGTCAGEGSSYAACPKKMTKCSLPTGQPVCLTHSTTFGLDSCRVAGVLAHNLPRQQCP